MKFNEIMYGDHVVLKAGEIELVPGKVTCVTGESGSGKTSLFRELLRNCRCHVSIDAQEPEFLDGLTLNEHLCLGPELWGACLPMDMLVERLGLAKLRDKPMASLSGGERKRAAFCACIGTDADMYFLDEPTASQNMEYAAIYIELLDSLRKRNKPILLFTHDKEMMGCADLSYEIKDGTMEAKQLFKSDTSEIQSSALPNIKILQKTFSLLKERQKGYMKAMSFMLTLSILLVCFFNTYSTIVAKAQKKTMDSVQSDEIVVFKTEPRLDDDYDILRYNKLTGNPWFTDEEIEEITAIPHVKEVQWRYDSEGLLGLGVALHDITVEG